MARVVAAPAATPAVPAATPALASSEQVRTSLSPPRHHKSRYETTGPKLPRCLTPPPRPGAASPGQAPLRCSTPLPRPSAGRHDQTALFRDELQLVAQESFLDHGSFCIVVFILSVLYVLSRLVPAHKQVCIAQFVRSVTDSIFVCNRRPRTCHASEVLFFRIALVSWRCVHV